jgi:hypothetical protein
VPALEVCALHQKAVLWTRASSFDRDGTQQVNTAVEINVRWERTGKQVAGPSNSTITEDSLVVVDRDITEQSIMWLGKFVDLPSTLVDLREVFTFKSIPDLKGRNFRRTVSLIWHSDTLPTIAS